MNPLIILTGPTAVGKTELSLELAQRVNAEIVSADSMQVYKYMDIGTAKPSLKERESVPHHLLDLVRPDQDFSVADYQRHFQQTVNSIYDRGKLPLLTGGTGLYIRACIQGFDLEPGGPLPSLRRELKEQIEEYGPQYLYQRLLTVDPEAAEKIHPNDQRRVIRALEVFLSTGAPISKLQRNRSSNYQFKLIYIFLNRDRDELYRRIEDRVEQMIEAGLVEEVNSLIKKGFSPQLKPMQSLGYKQISNYLFQNFSLEEAITSIKQETRRYAKRQLTWFRREPIDYAVTITGDSQEFFGDILNYIEGRLGNDVE
ncbi:MAG: tRNA (adenosine(37)-N6)-dimethylallyltransferase MiaA [Firmicutes bacterium]|nr:tRNA (adenosine(37)-N6)-dimethylallyltransferase MiaA [Bacillota bacterium]